MKFDVWVFFEEEEEGEGEEEEEEEEEEEDLQLIPEVTNISNSRNVM